MGALRRHAVAWITRGEPADARRITLTRRRIYILPTRAGYGFGLILIVMLLGATNYSNSMAFALTFLLGSLGANAMWQTHRNLLRLEVIVEGVAPVFAGQQASLRVALRNPGRQDRPGIRLRTEKQVPRVIDVPAQGHAELDIPLSAPRRGLHPIGRLRVDSQFPLGLFEAWSWPAYTTDLLVYPKPADPAPPPPFGVASGGKGAPVRGEGDEFAGLRKYQAGDTPGRVAWKAVARTGRWMTREFEANRSDDRWLRWDDLGAYGIEQRLSILCRWVLDAHREGAPYGLELPGQVLTPAASEAHRHACLKALALYAIPSRGAA
ncbi:MAG TPA: DUF58 domain-containing protein [Thioalkalivibrio sp.]|nr:DUF58 domain-containing protein [Thioalkalivibrio sp.]